MGLPGSVWIMDSYLVHIRNILNPSVFILTSLGIYPCFSLKLAPLDCAGLGSDYFFRFCSPAFLKAVNFQNLLSIRIFQWGICTHFQTNKLQSSPPALTTCRSPLVNRMFATWGECPRNLLCFANFSGHGKSNNLTMPKSSPVTRLIPERETQAQLTSAFSACLDQIPITSSPRILVHVAQVILSMAAWSIRCFPEGTS